MEKINSRSLKETHSSGQSMKKNKQLQDSNYLGGGKERKGMRDRLALTLSATLLLVYFKASEDVLSFHKYFKF